jgi:hypothetical protein
MEQSNQRFFRDCTLRFLDDTFALQQADSLPSLDNWLACAYAISHDYSGLTKEIFDIFRILKGSKQIVIERTA